MRPSVVVADLLEASAVEELSRRFFVTYCPGLEREALFRAVGDADALVVRSAVNVDEELLEAASHLQVVVRAGSGIDNVDIDAAKTAGVKVCRVPGVSTGAVAELAIGLAIAVARRIRWMDAGLRLGIDRKSRAEGLELAGRCAGIVGVGAIGLRTGRLLRAFGMEVLGCVANPSPVRGLRLAEDGIRLVPCHDLLERATLLSIHVPLTKATTLLIGAAELERLPLGALVINTARADVLDVDPLIEMLDAGRIGGAGLDVFHQKDLGRLTARDDVVLTPHVGAMTGDAQHTIGELVIRGLVEHFESQKKRETTPI